MSDKEKGLYKKYEVKKLSNPTKQLDCIVLEFDDPIARAGIKAFADACWKAGYDELAMDLKAKLEHYS